MAWELIKFVKLCLFLLSSKRLVPMVGSTILVAISTLGLTLWHRFRIYPFHTSDNTNSEQTFNIREHLAAIDSVSSSKKILTSNYTIIPQLNGLCYLLQSSQWSQRSRCQHCYWSVLFCNALLWILLSAEVRTVMTRLGGIRFYSNDYQLIPHHYPDLIKLALLTGSSLKTRRTDWKYDTHMQMETHDSLLFPVIRLGRPV